MPTAIKLNEKFATFTEHFRPKVIAELNGQEVKIVKAHGEFPWHHHDHEDGARHLQAGLEGIQRRTDA